MTVRAALLALLCLGCAAPRAPADESNARPQMGGELPCRSGPFQQSMSHASLTTAYGAQHVIAESLEDEGGSFVQTTIFPDDPSRRLSVRWRDDRTRSVPESISISGRSSNWTAPLELSLGMTIEEMERINGRPFEILGFGWDYGGQLWDTHGGAIDRDVGGCRLFVFFQANGEISDDLMGDRGIMSNAFALRAAHLTVREIALRYP